MTKVPLKVKKIRKPVSLWVHPEGMVVGSLFLKEDKLEDGGKEQPQDVLNNNSPFVVLVRENPDELRFYNQNSIIRVLYDAQDSINTEDKTTINCELTMMDGVILEGNIIETLPPEHARLFDYLNQEDCRFLKLYLEDNQVCLVNKTYINYVTAKTNAG